MPDMGAPPPGFRPTGVLYDELGQMRSETELGLDERGDVLAAVADIEHLAGVHDVGEATIIADLIDRLTELGLDGGKELYLLLLHILLGHVIEVLDALGEVLQLLLLTALDGLDHSLLLLDEVLVLGLKLLLKLHESVLVLLGEVVELGLHGLHLRHLTEHLLRVYDTDLVALRTGKDGEEHCSTEDEKRSFHGNVSYVIDLYSGS